MNEVHRSLTIFLSSFCIFASINCKPTLADNTVLKGGAEHSEKMQKSIKLMVPDAIAPPPVQPARPYQFQTGTSRIQQTRTPTDWQALQEQAAQFRAESAAIRAAALQRQQAEAAHQALIEKHFGTEIETTPVFRSPFIKPVRVPQDQPAQPVVQIDPWTDVQAVPYRQKKLAELQASIKQLHATPITTTTLTPNLIPAATTAVQLQPVPEVHEAPLTAVEKMLPMTPPPKDWNSWYKRVASAIYDRWKQNTAGPGTSVVLITVYDSRDVDCRVTDFKEAEGAAANSVEETRFKQISLQCVDGLSGDEVWQFPAVQPIPKKIVFDMEFKHVVGQDSGCRIVHLHNELPQ